MSHVTGVHHTSFTVADLDQSLAFFRDRLGLEVVYTREIRTEYFAAIVGLPSCVTKAALLRVPEAQHHVELFQYLTPPTVASDHRLRPCDAGSHHLALLVSNLAELCRELRSHGVELLSDPVAVSSGPNAGAWAAYLRDPNGILLELFQPPPRSAAADWWRGLIVMAYMTGWRISELLAVKRTDVDLEKGTALTRAADNKGERDDLIRLHPVVIGHLQRLRGFDPFMFPWAAMNEDYMPSSHASRKRQEFTCHAQRFTSIPASVISMASMICGGRSPA